MAHIKLDLRLDLLSYQPLCLGDNQACRARQG